jgi:hypothetical protein
MQNSFIENTGQTAPPRDTAASVSQLQSRLPFLLDNCERDFKQKSRRNKKLRFRKPDKRRLAEKWVSPCSV